MLQQRKILIYKNLLIFINIDLIKKLIQKFRNGNKSKTITKYS